MFIAQLIRRIIAGLVVLIALSCSAAEVSKIIVQGNKRIPSSSIIAYSQLSPGIEVRQDDITQAIKSVYSKALFDQVEITFKDRIIFITVKERPIIRKIDFKKNSLIPEEGMNDLLKQSHLESGEVLDPSQLKQVKAIIAQQYRLSGYPDVKVVDEVTEVGRGMVDIKVVVLRGKQYQVRRVNIDGNLAFTDRQLQAKMQLGTPTLYARIFGGNYFSDQAFERSKAELTQFYIDQGFLKFAIEKAGVERVEGTQFFDVTIKLTEGPRFTYGHIGVYGDKRVRQTNFDFIQRLQQGIQKGDKLPFSRSDIFKLQKRIMKRLEEDGYTVRAVEPKVNIDEENATVDVKYFVQQGVPTLVRRIEFKGNTLTMDKVLRRELALAESEVYSETAVSESIRRLSNLGYVKNIKHEVLTTDSPREVDLIFMLEEAPQATANLEMGANDTDSIVFTALLSHPNVGGTGNDVDLKFEKSRVRTTVSIKGAVPFVLDNGLGVRYNLYYNKREDSTDTTSVSQYTWQQAYASEKFGLNLSISTPISLYQDLALSAELNKNNYSYNENDESIPDSFSESIDRYGNNLWTVVVDGKWSRNTLDRAILPTSGSRQEVDIKLGMPLNESFTSYITVDNRFTAFHKVGDRWPVTFNPVLRLGIGQGFRGFTNITGCLVSSSNDDSCNTELPFDQKFYGGVTSPVRGIMTFGEKVNGKAVGGDLITTASLNMFLKTFNNDQVIPSLYVDGGYVFNDHAFDLGKWVYSTGLQVRVMTPIAPITLISAYPIKIDEEGDPYGKDSFRYFKFSMQANLY